LPARAGTRNPLVTPRSRVLRNPGDRPGSHFIDRPAHQRIVSHIRLLRAGAPLKQP
jgi:hypothetical protein